MEPAPLPIETLTASDLDIEALGSCEVDSPLVGRRERFARDDDRVLVCSRTRELDDYGARNEPPPAFERAGARRRIHFDPTEVVAGIVSCGGLCPGINNVVRSLVLTLTYAYGIERILGFRYGYAGLAG
ncbi:MAG: ATP-dependent 6-phosphofructokinase, partial [Acidobacteriota bacterium]